LKILLIGNYEPDKQQSMLRFLAIMTQEMRSAGFNIDAIQPAPILGKINFGTKLLKKWLGYIDKFIIFPFTLLKIRNKYDLIHILDHSNAIYTNWLEARKCIITFHDAIGIKSATGKIKEFSASSTGKILQKWILNGLKTSKMIISVSKFSEDELKELLADKAESIQLKVIHNGLNFPFKKDKGTKNHQSKWSFISKPFILNVGNNHERKNRKGVLKAFAEISDKWNGSLVFVGPELSPELTNLANSLGIKNKIHVVTNPDNASLTIFYSHSYALLFPSLYEGFGWPVIEAQACGCPVVCSNRGPFPEILKDSALMSYVEDIKDFAENLLKLEDKDFREKMIAKGLENAKHFSSQEMAKKYSEAYREAYRETSKS
jgi:glycosyltransferase involved in cell wall biosynthesis